MNENKLYFAIGNIKAELLTRAADKLVFTKNVELAIVFDSEKEAVEFEDKYSNDINGLTYIYTIKNKKVKRLVENIKFREYIKSIL